MLLLSKFSWYWAGGDHELCNSEFFAPLKQIWLALDVFHNHTVIAVRRGLIVVSRTATASSATQTLTYLFPQSTLMTTGKDSFGDVRIILGQLVLGRSTLTYSH